MPNGFAFADQVFREASIKDSISLEQRANAALERALRYVVKRYPKRIRVRWVNPWSLNGLVVCARYRIRSFPAVVINKRDVLTGEGLALESLNAKIAQILSRSIDD